MSNQIAAQEDSARETQAQRDRDEIYANDVNALAATFRTEYVNAFQSRNALTFESVLWSMSRRLQLSKASSDQFLQQVFDDHGPGAVLLALKRAYDQPEHVTSDVVEHP